MEIKEIAKRQISCEVKLEFFKENELPVKLILAQSLLKNAERFEFVLQKCTELGVSEFIPLLTKRTEQKFLHKKERLERILKEATEQSGRARLPKLEELGKFADVLKLKNVLVLMPHPVADEKFADIKARLGSASRDILICIGPEGGFMEDEVDLARESGALIFNIGKRILRAETAAIVMATLVGEWVEGM